MSQLASDGNVASKHHDDEPDRPPDYDEIRSILEFLGPLFEWVGRFVLYALVISLFVWLIPGVWQTALIASIIVGLFCIWRIMSAHWAWKHRRIKINGGTGLITVEQGGPLWLGLPESSDDTASLADTPLDTPPRTLWQRHFLFNCNTIILKLPSRMLVLSNVKRPEHVQAIQEYAKSLKKQDLIQQKLQTRLQEEAVEILRQWNQSSWTTAPDRPVPDETPALLVASTPSEVESPSSPNEGNKTEEADNTDTD